MMIKINRKSLSAVLESAFDAGKLGPADEKESVVRELLTKLRNMKFRAYTLAELRHLPAGKRLFHPMLGEGEVVLNERQYGLSFNKKVLSFTQENADILCYPMAEINGLKPSHFTYHQAT